MSSDPSKTSAQLSSTKGGMKETVGKMTGSADLQESGREERAKGQAELSQSKAQGYAEGTKDRIGGTAESAVGAMKGDQAKQSGGNFRRDIGSTQQDVNRNL